MTNVYCIDNDGAKHADYYFPLAEALRGERRLVFKGLPKGDQTPQDVASDSVAPASIFEACTDSSPAIILLDLGGVTVESRSAMLEELLAGKCEQLVSVDARYQQLKEALSRLPSLEFSETFQKTFVCFFVCSAARIFRKTVFLFSTEPDGRGDIGAYTMHFRIENLFAGETSHFIQLATKKLLAAATQSPVERAVEVFLEECKYDPFAWRHDNCKSDRTKSAAARALGLESELHEEDVKALFLLEPDKPEYPFAPFGFASKKISINGLEQVLRGMQFPCQLDLPKDEADLKLPMQPGFVFLCGLRQMLDHIDRQVPSGDQLQQCHLHFGRVDKSYGLKRYGDVYYARLVFPKQYSKNADHIYRYREKVLAGLAAPSPSQETVSETQATGKLTLFVDKVARGRIALQELAIDRTLKNLPVANHIDSGPTRRVAPPAESNAKSLDESKAAPERDRRIATSVATLALVPGEIAFYWN